MKLKISIIVVIIISFFVLTGLNYYASHSNSIKIKLEESINQGDWGPWKETNCYKDLDFRVKNRGKNYDGTKTKWSVQFRNRYYDKIFFSYEVYDRIPSNPRTTNRTDLDSQKISSGYRDFYMQNGNSIYVYVDKVRFKTDGLQDYYNCDK